MGVNKIKSTQKIHIETYYAKQLKIVRLMMEVFCLVILSCSQKPWTVPRAKCGTPPYELLVRETLEVTETLQAYNITLCCPTELSDKTLLLKIPQTLNVKYTETKPEQCSKLPPCSPAFMIPKSATQAVIEGNPPVILLNCELYKL